MTNLHGLVDVAAPLNMGCALNNCILNDWTIVRNSGWRNGVTVRDLARGTRNPRDGTKSSATTWATGLGRPGGYGSLVMTANAADGVDTGSRVGPAGGFSFAMWVRPATVSPTQLLAAQFLSGGNCYFQFYMASGGLIAGRINQSSSVHIGRSVSGVMTTTSWQHVAMTWNGGTTAASIRVYRNGVAVDTTNDNAGSFTAAGTGEQTLWLGKQNAGNNYNGEMDAAMSFYRGLSDAEIAALYQETRAGNPNRFNWIIKPWSLGVEVVAGGGVEVTPSTAALTLTAFAPTVATPRLVTPTTKSLTLATFAPTVSTPRLCTPTTTALTLTAFAPTVNAGQTATPTTASLTLATFAPTVTATANQRVTPTTASLSLTGFAPTVSTPRTVTPTTAGLTITLFAPTVSTPRTATPTTLALTLTKFAPTVTATGSFTFDTICPLPIPLFARTPLEIPMVARDPLAVPLVGCRNEV